MARPRRELVGRVARCRSRLESLRHALRGLRKAWRTQPNLRLQASAGSLVVMLGWWCGLTRVEWLWVSFAVGLVLFAELMNTAIEGTVDFVVRGRYDPHARRVKDASAGFVLTAAALAAVIGAFTFLPRLLGA